METLPAEANPPARIYLGFVGRIESTAVPKIAAAINAYANAGVREITLCLTSAGGLVGDGIYLYNHLRGLPVDITIHNTGTVASIAVAVFRAGKHRVCSKHGVFLIHPTVVASRPTGMSVEQLRAGVDSALADDKRTEDILRSHTALPNEILSKRLLGDVWITADTALQYGLVHSIEEFNLPPGQKVLQL